MCAREDIKELVETTVAVVSAQEGRQQKLDVLSSADNDLLYVLTECDDELVVVGLVTDEIVKKYPVGDTPNEIEITPDDRSPPVAADEGRLFLGEESLFSPPTIFRTF